MSTSASRLVSSAVAYAAGILLAAEIGPATLEAIATATTAGWHAIGGALAAGSHAVAQTARDIQVLAAVLAPPALLAMTTILGLMVWPAIVDHVPNADPAPADRDAEVVALPARRRLPRPRRAA